MLQYKQVYFFLESNRIVKNLVNMYYSISLFK